MKWAIVWMIALLITVRSCTLKTTKGITKGSMVIVLGNFGDVLIQTRGVEKPKDGKFLRKNFWSVGCL